MLLKSTSLMWSAPRPETSLTTIPLLRIFTLLPDIPRIIGWPTPDPKSVDETPNKSSIDSPRLCEAELDISSPLTTWSGFSISDNVWSI